MTKDRLWAIFVEKNPKWEAEGANLTADGLKKLFDTTFDQGHNLGVKNGKALASRSADNHSNKYGNSSSILKDMFNL